jgi:hypothetical protein
LPQWLGRSLTRISIREELTMWTKVLWAVALTGGVAYSGLHSGGSSGGCDRCCALTMPSENAADCCYPGSPCCFPGSPCCEGSCCPTGSCSPDGDCCDQAKADAPADCCNPASPCCPGGACCGGK